MPKAMPHTIDNNLFQGLILFVIYTYTWVMRCWQIKDGHRNETIPLRNNKKIFVFAFIVRSVAFQYTSNNV